jgi:hypothetical protein
MFELLFLLQLGPCAKLVLKCVLAIVLVELHDDELAVIDVAEILEVLHAPVVPFHKEDPRHETMCDKNTDAGKVLFPKRPPQRLVEPTNSVICVGSRFTVWDPIEKVPIIRPLKPHALHLRRAWLEVAKILLSQPWLLINLDGVSWKGRGRRCIGGEGLEYTFGCLPGSAIG